jgi:hypothetical protein
MSSTSTFLIPARAWERYNDKQRDERALFPARTQADMIHAYMAAVARDLLTGRSGVVLSPPAFQAFSIEVFSTWLFRLHKLNDDLTISINTTTLALEFVGQVVQLDLPFGEQPLTNLHLGYRTNATNSGLASVHVVCPKSEEEVSWHYTLLPSDSGTDPTQIPVAPTPGPRPRLRPIELPVRERDAGA